MKNKIISLGIYWVFVAGIGFLSYPTVSDWLCQYEAKNEIASYNEVVQEEPEEDISDMKDLASQYNMALAKGNAGQSVVSYDDLLAVTDAIAYLEIPKLSIDLPIYHGLEDEVLEKGIGHMPESSLPVGGTSTHCVLSGHTGLPSAKLLTKLDQLVIGDLFYIHVLDETLVYAVDQIKTVLPEETDDIQIVDGKDYVTILTCTPYGVNTHRLLVRGIRSEDPGTGTISIQAPEKQIKKGFLTGEMLKLLIEIGAVVVVLGGSAVILIPKKKKGKEGIENERENI